jgi:two-component system chemotaxis sensor kinase CheA
MNDLLQEFLTETNESLDVVDVELVRFEREPNNAQILGNIFRLVHTIKGTCGFLGLPRLETLTHAAETLMGKFRDGMPVTQDAVTLILAVIDRIKEILTELERNQNEPTGADDDLIRELEHASQGDAAAPVFAPVANPAVGTLVDQVLERPLRPGEISLDELERAFREAPGPEQTPSKPVKGAVAPNERRAMQDRRDEERRDNVAMTQTLRVQVETLERLMTMVSELVLTRNQLLEILRNNEDNELKAPFQRLSKITGELQEGVMKTRMQPIGNAWAKLPRVVRDLSAELGKKIEIVVRGEDTELDRQVIELIKDPLTHMVRNSADHGIETPEGRRAAGKPEEGTIRLSAHHEGGHIIIEIADDGRGLDTERILAKATRLGLLSEEEAGKLTEAQIHKFIFAPGFSTATAVTSISGRGVGMDVVKSNIDQIGGTIDLKSSFGQGMSFRIKIPLTLAIISALLVEADGDRFAIPQMAVIELVHVDADSEHRIERIKDASILRLRNKLLPLVHLKSLLRLAEAKIEDAEAFVVVMQVGSHTFGIVVDQVFHTEEIVVKPMSSMLRHIAEFSGNTILGDGSVIMILDPNGMAAAIGSDIDASMVAEERMDEARVDDSDAKTSLLVFRAGSDEPKAVSLALVTRLEKIDARAIEFSNGRHLVQYRGSLMPLLRINDNVRLRSEGAQPLLVFIDRDRFMGLVVDEIVDIVEDRLEITIGSHTPGILGTAVVNGRATEIIDVGHFLPLAFEDWLQHTEMNGAARPRRVLLVDDSAFFRNMLTPVLKAAGYALKTAASAEDALALIEQDAQFDVVISDIEMPGMNGFELAEKLGANPRTAHLTRIAISALTAPATVERGRQAGFHDFIGKFDRNGLLAALKRSAAEWPQAA